MEDSTVWWLLTGGAVALELLTGTFFLLMLAIGFAAGALAAHLGLDLAAQFVSGALVGGGAVVGWHKWRKINRPALPASANQDVNMDVGQTVQVEHWEPNGTAHVKYRGADWSVSLSTPNVHAPPGPYRIVAIEGSRLIVAPS
jgi:membrane protein implicated in regulation of membrane protease activity